MKEFLQEMTHSDYLSNPAISQSELSYLSSTTPYHYHYKKTNPKNTQTPDMLIGSAVHKFFFERDDFSGEYVTAPDLNLRTKAGREEMAEFKLSIEKSGKTVLTCEQMKKVTDMGGALFSQEHVTDLVRNGVFERAVFRPWDDLTLKCKPDYYIEETNTIIDLKTCRDITHRGFIKSVIDYKYYLQASYYSDAVSHHVGEKPRFIFVCVEKTAPYRAAIYELDASFLMVGRAEYMAALDTIESCSASNEWPSYGCEPIDLSCPDWLWEKHKKRISS